MDYSCHIPSPKSTAREQHNLVSEGNTSASVMIPAQYNSVSLANFFFFFKRYKKLTEIKITKFKTKLSRQLAESQSHSVSKVIP